MLKMKRKKNWIKVNADDEMEDDVHDKKTNTTLDNFLVNNSLENKNSEYLISDNSEEHSEEFKKKLNNIQASGDYMEWFSKLPKYQKERWRIWENLHKKAIDNYQIDTNDEGLMNINQFDSYLNKLKLSRKYWDLHKEDDSKKWTEYLSLLIDNTTHNKQSNESRPSNQDFIRYSKTPWKISKYDKKVFAYEVGKHVEESTYDTGTVFINTKGKLVNCNACGSMDDQAGQILYDSRLRRMGVDIAAVNGTAHEDLLHITGYVSLDKFWKDEISKIFKLKIHIFRKPTTLQIDSIIKYIRMSDIQPDNINVISFNDSTGKKTKNIYGKTETQFIKLLMDSLQASPVWDDVDGTKDLKYYKGYNPKNVEPGSRLSNVAKVAKKYLLPNRNASIKKTKEIIFPINDDMESVYVLDEKNELIKTFIRGTKKLNNQGIEWDESKHLRNDDGKFGSGAGSGKSNSEEKETKLIKHTREKPYNNNGKIKVSVMENAEGDEKLQAIIDECIDVWNQIETDVDLAEFKVDDRTSSLSLGAIGGYNRNTKVIDIRYHSHRYHVTRS